MRVFLLVSAFETPAAWAMLLPVFAHAKPEWTCGDGAADGNATGNATEQCIANGSICDGANYTSDFTSIVSEVIECPTNEQRDTPSVSNSTTLLAHLLYI